MAFARPKSSTFTVPSARTLMFAGLRSRWMMPCSCAASRASAICFAIGSASSIGIGAARDALRQILALDQFHDEGASRRRFLRDRGCAAMFGWFSDASIFGFALKPRQPIGIRRDRGAAGS